MAKENSHIPRLKMKCRVELYLAEVAAAAETMVLVQGEEAGVVAEEGVTLARAVKAGLVLVQVAVAKLLLKKRWDNYRRRQNPDKAEMEQTALLAMALGAGAVAEVMAGAMAKLMAETTKEKAAVVTMEAAQDPLPIQRLPCGKSGFPHL